MRLLPKKNARRLTKKRMPLIRNVLLLKGKTLGTPTTTGPTNMVAQKISVAITRPMVMMLHGISALIIISDNPIIVNPQAHHLILEIKSLEIVMGIAIRAIVIALIL